MRIELLIDNKNGNVFDISDLVLEVKWKTPRKGKASTLEFSILKDSNVNIGNGDVISFKVDGNSIFYGYVFDNGGDKGQEIKIVAYDQIRYLMYNDTHVSTNKKASEIITQIAQDVGLRVGTIEDTRYVIPSFLEDDKKLLDIIYKALETNLMNTGDTYVLFDDYGSLCLKNINNMKQSIVISDEVNLGNYEWKNSIDSDTYNRIKLVKDNKDKKGRDVYIAQDSNNIAKWGRLQYFKKVDEKMSKEQIEQMINATLKLKNKESKTLNLKDVLSLDLKEDLKLRGGAGVYVEIKDKDIKQYYLIEEATHTFSNGNLVMDFQLKVV